MGRDELVHNANARAYEFVLRLAASQSKFRKIHVGVTDLEQSVSGGDFNGGG
jgi:hypothetical protein